MPSYHQRLRGSLQRGLRAQQKGNVGHSPDPPRPHSELLCVLLRDCQQTSGGMQPGQRCKAVVFSPHWLFFYLLCATSTLLIQWGGEAWHGLFLCFIYSVLFLLFCFSSAFWLASPSLLFRFYSASSSSAEGHLNPSHHNEWSFACIHDLSLLRSVYISPRRMTRPWKMYSAHRILSLSKTAPWLCSCSVTI